MLTPLFPWHPLAVMLNPFFWFRFIESYKYWRTCCMMAVFFCMLTRKICYNLPGLKVRETLVAGKDIYFFVRVFLLFAFTSLLPYRFFLPCLSTGFITSFWRGGAGATMYPHTSHWEGITYLCIPCCSILSGFEIHLGLFNWVSFPSSFFLFSFFLFFLVPFFLFSFFLFPYPLSSAPMRREVSRLW